jgi:serine/threonine protein kinase
LPICGAASLHTSTIVHRDIKPANLLVFSLSSSETVVAKLTDLRAQRASPRATNKADIMQMASNDRSGLEGTPINMALELFDGSARPNEATDVHALGETCRAVHRDRIPVGHCESRRRRQAARVVLSGACPIGSLRSFAACGHQTPPLAPSCRTFCSSSTRNDADADGDSDSDDRSSVDEIVRTLSLRERHEEEHDTTVNRISLIEGVTCLGRLLSSLKFELCACCARGDCVLNVVVCVVLVSLRLLQWLR